MKKIIKIIYFTIFKIILFKFTSKKAIYIHIPRSIGTNLKYQVEQKMLFSRIIYFNHQKSNSYIYKKFKNHITFTFVRNPINWYLSYYNYKKVRNLQRGGKKNILENETFKNFFDDIILEINGVSGIKKWHQPFEENSIIGKLTKIKNKEIGFYTKLFLIYICDNEKKFLNSKIDYSYATNIINKFGFENIYKQENFIEAIKDLNNKFQTTLDHTLKINESIKQTKIEDLSKNEIATIKKKDYLIFKIFDYKY